eukprot:4774172-Pyramimonas_sp.AAC.1
MWNPSTLWAGRTGYLDETPLMNAGSRRGRASCAPSNPRSMRGSDVAFRGPLSLHTSVRSRESGSEMTRPPALKV